MTLPRLEAQFEPSTLVVDGCGRLTFVSAHGREEIVGVAHTWEDAKRYYAAAQTVWRRFSNSLARAP